jgi:acetyl-CoA carboxylase biotin carboxyl carrier protein
MDGKDFEELRELVEFLKDSGIAEFEMERPEMKVGLKFASPTAASVLAPSAMGGVDMAQLAKLMAAQGGGENVQSLAASQVGASAASVAEIPARPPADVDENAGVHVVKSPIVGTFYDAPSPDADPFVQIGDRVSVGKVLCIVEAMKLMNEIESDAEGEVVKVFVKPGQPVEYGQALFAVKE